MATDHIQVPSSVAFTNAAEEATKKPHELAHATAAQRIAEYILNFHPNYAAAHGPERPGTDSPTPA